MKPIHTLSLMTNYAPWETAYYIRHVLEDVPLQDHSLIDRLIDLTGQSFSHAVVACNFVRFGSAQAPHFRIRALVEPPPELLALPARMLSYTLLNIDIEIRSKLQQMPSIDALVTHDVDWSQLCDLHRFIAQECLHKMNELLRFNICSIPSSYISNDNPRIEPLVQQARDTGRITPALIYACFHWAYHASFALIDGGEQVVDLALDFLERHALHWLEILSLGGKDASNTIRPLSGSQVSNNVLLIPMNCKAHNKVSDLEWPVSRHDQ